MNRRKILLVQALLAITLPLHAKEGPDQFQAGSDTFGAGLLPNRGWHFSNELTYLDTFLVRVDEASAEHPQLDVTKMTQWRNTLRFTKVFDVELWGGELGMRATVPLLRNDWQDTEFGSDTFSSVGDVSLATLLGWHHDRLHVTAGLEAYFPTGHVERLLPDVSIGANYYSLEPSVAMTYQTAVFEASVKLGYNMKGKNVDTEYRSADEWRADYLAAWTAGRWSYGLSGYWINPSGNDRSPTQQSRGSGHASHALGPVVRYADAYHRTYSLQYLRDRSNDDNWGDGQLSLRFSMPL